MAKKKLSPEQMAKLDGLRDTSSTILTFLEEKGYLPYAEQFHAALARAYESRSVPALKAARADLDQRVRSLSPADQEGLTRCLQALDAASPLEDAKTTVETVVARGAITTEEEYRMVLERVEEIYSDLSREAEVTRLNELLSAAQEQDLA